MITDPEPLFLVQSEEAVVAPAVGWSALGTAAEYDIVARLLRIGHKVAVPVVDDDGVDLIVDYRMTVQVKTTRKIRNGAPAISLEQSQSPQHASTQRRRRSAVRPHVDVYAIWAEGIGWWLIPREAMPLKTLHLGSRMDQWREAWDVFARVAV